MSDALLTPRFLFRFAMPLHYQKVPWAESGSALGPACRLPNLGQLDAQREFADVRVAWSELGIGVELQVSGKKKPIWCRESRLEDSDSLQVWIDTRCTHGIHRASRYCHRFVFLPAGEGRGHADPIADQLLINRARENARPIRQQMLKVRSKVTAGGYELAGFIPADALTGYDPAEHPQLGFTFAVYDREFGLQTGSVGVEFPYEEDPSTWATLDLIR